MVLLALMAPLGWAQPAFATEPVRRDMPQPPEPEAPKPEAGSWSFARSEMPVSADDPGEIAETIADLMDEHRMLQATAGWINVPPRWVETSFVPKSHYGRRLLADFR